jgi:hypothetical protein
MRIHSIILFLFIILTFGCQRRFVKSIHDKRIPEEARQELGEIRFDPEAPDSVVTTTSFILELNSRKVNEVHITQILNLKDSARYSYRLLNIIRNRFSTQDPYNAMDSSVVSTKAFEYNMALYQKPVYYCKPHNGARHRTEHQDSIEVYVKRFNCDRVWDLKWEKR